MWNEKKKSDEGQVKRLCGLEFHRELSYAKKKIVMEIHKDFPSVMTKYQVYPCRIKFSEACQDQGKEKLPEISKTIWTSPTRCVNYSKSIQWEWTDVN